MGSLRSKIRAQLISDIYTAHIVIVVENEGRNRQFLLNFIAKDLASLSGTAGGKWRTFSRGNFGVATWRCMTSLDFKLCS